MERRLYRCTLLILMAVLLLGCQPNNGVTIVPTTEPTTQPTTTPTTAPTTEPTVSDDSFIWLADEWESMSYEEFSSQEVVYNTMHNGSLLAWYVQLDDGSELCFVLNADSEGFYIQDGYFGDIIARIPDTADLVPSTEKDREQRNWYVRNQRNLYVRNGGELLCVSLETGERSVLYSADAFRGNMVLANRDILYFLSVSNGILCLNRLYLPTMTLDILYAQKEPEVPESWYKLIPPESNRAVVYWETVNPSIWNVIMDIQDDPDSSIRSIPFLAQNPDALNAEDICASPWDEYYKLVLSVIQDEVNIRSRLLSCYDPTTDSCSVLYGVYDVCVTTPIHAYFEHFAEYEEVEP